MANSSSQYSVQTIILRQLRDKVNALVGTRLPLPPKQGWIRTLREALDMSGAQLGERLNMSRNKVSILERKEAEGTITLNQLKELASGIEGELVYAIVPKRNVDEILHQRAHELAEQRVNAGHQNMFLEAQQLSQEKQSQNIELLANELKNIGGRVLWKSGRKESGL